MVVGCVFVFLRKLIFLFLQPFLSRKTKVLKNFNKSRQMTATKRSFYRGSYLSHLPRPEA